MPPVGILNPPSLTVWAHGQLSGWSTLHGLGSRGSNLGPVILHTLTPPQNQLPVQLNEKRLGSYHRCSRSDRGCCANRADPLELLSIRDDKGQVGDSGHNARHIAVR